MYTNLRIPLQFLSYPNHTHLLTSFPQFCTCIHASNARLKYLCRNLRREPLVVRQRNQILFSWPEIAIIGGECGADEEECEGEE
jgi:hypothetical protein